MKSEESNAVDQLPVAERSPDYLRVLGEIETALATGDELECIKGRLATLNEGAQAVEMSHLWHSIHKGFLGPGMQVSRNMLVDPFVLDDEDLYTTFFDTIKEFKSTEGWKERTIREIMFFAIQGAISQYFGNAIGYGDTENKNREFYMDHSAADSAAISIKELKGKHFAVCAEKAAAAQNLLAFVGLDSDLIAANCRLPAEADPNPHYFILLNAPKIYAIYNPTNPKVVLNEKNELITYSPATYPVSEDQYKSIISGGSVEVEHLDEKVVEGAEKETIKSQRLYGGPKQN